MPGPLPKPDHERERRNAADRFVEAGPTPGAEPPPTIPPAEWRRWCATAQLWWGAVTRSPAAAMYTAPDWENARRCAHLLNDADDAIANGAIGGATSLLREVRALEDRLLLTVRARRMARVELPEPDEDEDLGDVDYRAMLGDRGND